MLADSPNQLGEKGATGLTPSQKLSKIAKRYGMPGLLKMQPTEQIIYDSIDIATFSTTGSNTISFFANTNTKNFPFTNLQQNKLNSGNVIVVQYLQLQLITAVNGVITNFQTLEEDQSELLDATYKTLLLSELTLVLGSSEVFKDFPLTNGYAGFNPNATFGSKTRSPAAGNKIVQYGSSNIELASEPVILPNLEFKANLKVPALTALPAANTKFLRLSMGGFGTIPSMGKPM